MRPQVEIDLILVKTSGRKGSASQKERTFGMCFQEAREAVSSGAEVRQRFRGSEMERTGKRERETTVNPPYMRGPQ